MPWSTLDGDTLTVSRTRTNKSAARTPVIAVPATTARELREWRVDYRGRGEDPIIGPLGEAGLRIRADKYLDPAAGRATGRSDVTMYAGLEALIAAARGTPVFRHGSASGG